MTFSEWQIALTALIAGLAGMAALALWRRSIRIEEMLLVALIVGLSVFVYRRSTNIPTLNTDPVPGFSPNDLICPLVTYVWLSIYIAFRRPQAAVQWGQAQAALTIVSFLVNVITI